MSGAFRRFGPESPFDDPFGHMRATARSFLGHTTSDLGYVSPQNTYWYLTATPPVLEPASARFEAFVDGKGTP